MPPVPESDYGPPRDKLVDREFMTSDVGDKIAGADVLQIS